MAQAERAEMTVVDASATPFKVVRHYIEMVPTRRTDVLCETSDPVEAHVVVHDWIRAHPRERIQVPSIEGEHSTHEWDGDLCTACGSPRRGCIMSHLPCGYEYDNNGPLIVLMNAWRGSNGTS